MSFFMIIPALMIIGIYSAFEVFLYSLGIGIALLVKRFRRLKRIRIKLTKVYLRIVAFFFIRFLCVFVVIALFDFYYQVSNAPITFLTIILSFIIDLSLLFLSLFSLKNNIAKKINYCITGISIISSLLIATASVMISYTLTVWGS